MRLKKIICCVLIFITAFVVMTAYRNDGTDNETTASTDENTHNDTENTSAVPEPAANKLIYYAGEAGGGKTVEISLENGGTVVLETCMFEPSKGYVFQGWTDGKGMYQPGDQYIIAVNKGAVMTAVWETVALYEVKYCDESSVSGGTYYEGETIKLSSCMFYREGYRFAGWNAGGETILPGLNYMVKEGDNMLNAVWEKTDDAGLISDASEAWLLSDGGASDTAKSAVGKTDGTLKWTVWLNSDTFGRVLDFSTAGSMLKAAGSKADLSGDFTLSSWVFLPPRENEDRVILSQGNVSDKKYINYTTVSDVSGASWRGTKITYGKDGEIDYVSGAVTGQNDVVIVRNLGAKDYSGYLSGGYLHVWICVDNPSAITGGQFELTSSGKSDEKETSWNVSFGMLKSGWNELYLSVNSAQPVGGGADFSKINYVRFYLNCSDSVEARLSKVELCTKNSSASETDWCLYAEGGTGNLVFDAAGLEGAVSSGKKIADGKWHHVMVTKAGGTLTYYVDGKSVKTCAVTGSVRSGSKDLYAGTLPDGTKGLDGSLAHVCIYGSAKLPSEVTSVVIKESDNAAKPTAVPLKHGITTDRSQGFGKTSSVPFTKQDVQNCIDMGFDHIRIIVWMDNMIAEDGSLKKEYIEFAIAQANTIIEGGLPCVFSLAAGNRPVVNGTYLSETGDFERTVKWFGEFAEFIREQGWTSDQLAVLLFCEPYCYVSERNWTWMSDRIYSAVRNVLPDHTILTSSDNYGYIEDLKKMSPVTDSNVIYTFTSYEPYTVAFNTFNGWNVENSFWSYIKDIPYPIQKGVDYSDEIEAAIALVPAGLKEAARNALTLYVRGISDCGRPNLYDSLYNEEWHMLRAKSLNDWSEKYGGIKILVAELGGCDAIANKTWFGAAAGTGISEETRLKLISDSIKAYNAYGISWTFWEYNESFTVFDPSVRMGTSSISAEQFKELVYPPMLDALGLDYTLPD